MIKNYHHLFYNSLKYLTGIFICLISLNVAAQTDTVFWFAAPEVSQTAPQDLDRPIYLRLTTYSQAAIVTITQPAMPVGAGMPVQTITIAANSTQTVNLTTWIDSIENKPSNTTLNYGLKIKSTASITAYYQVAHPDNPEAFILKGRNALGTDFWIPSQNFVQNNPPGVPTPYSAFDIVATDNNTVVTITPANNIIGHAQGIPFTVTLNAGQTYSAAATGTAPTAHLQGSRVTATKPVAITVKDDLLNESTIYLGTCGDLGGDQIVPTNIIGTEYIAMNGLLYGPGDQLFITATQNGTTISQNGTMVTTINAGQTYRLPIGISVASTYVQTSAPAYVWQLSGMGCEMGLGMLPRITCTGSYDVSFVRSTPQQLYLNLMLKNGGQNNFLVNGVAGVIPGTAFNPVPGTGGQWVAAQVQLPASTYPQGSVISVSNPSSLFHIGVLDGGTSGGTSYGYFSDFGNIVAHARAFSSSVCEGTPIQLFADTVSGATYTWTGPAMYASSQQNPVVSNTTTAQSGYYKLTVNVAGCSSAVDSVNVTVQKVIVDLGNDTGTCGEPIVLGSKTSYTAPAYLWSTGATTPTITIAQPNLYWLQVTENGCVGRDTINVNTKGALKVDLGADKELCYPETIVLRSPQPPGTQYAWNTGVTDTEIVASNTGTYWLTVSRNSCTGSDTVNVTVTVSPIVDIGNDTTVCEGSSVNIGTALPNAKYLWSTGSTDAYIDVTTTGDYWLRVTQRACVVYDTMTFTAIPPPEFDLGSDKNICENDTVVLVPVFTHPGNDGAYLWNTGATTDSVSVYDAGLYWLQITSELGCMASDSLLIKIAPEPKVILGNDTIICEETPLTLMPVYSIYEDRLRWSNGSNDRQITITEGGTYIVWAINECGAASDTIHVKQIFCDIWLPNAFTPNNDGVNDVYRLLGNIGQLQNFSFSIFNRWGERIFFTDDKYKGWDGYFNGGKVELGTYVYVITADFKGKPLFMKGNFHLLY